MFKAIAVLLLALAAPAGAADLCSSAVSEVATRGAWKRTVKDDVVTFRAPSGAEALTMAVYRIDERFATAAKRAEVLTRSAEFDRGMERKLSRTVTLTAVRRAEADGVLQLCYSGEDPADGRRFVSLSLAAGQFVQHIYYEAAGFTRLEFARNAQAVFAFDPASGGTLAQGRRIDPRVALVRMPSLIGR